MAKYTKCSFCPFFVGRECTAAAASGYVDPARCRQAEYEYKNWLKKQKQKEKPSYWR